MMVIGADVVGEMSRVEKRAMALVEVAAQKAGPVLQSCDGPGAVTGEDDRQGREIGD